MSEVREGTRPSTLEVAQLSARIAASKRAEDIVILDVESLIFLAEFFVIASGTNRRQIQSIAEEIRLRMKERGVKEYGVEGYTEGTWILMDYGDVIVHIFLDEVRKYYDLEMLWGDARRVPFEEESPPAANA